MNFTGFPSNYINATKFPSSSLNGRGVRFPDETQGFHSAPLDDTGFHYDVLDVTEYLSEYLNVTGISSDSLDETGFPSGSLNLTGSPSDPFDLTGFSSGFLSVSGFPSNSLNETGFPSINLEFNTSLFADDPSNSSINQENAEFFEIQQGSVLYSVLIFFYAIIVILGTCGNIMTIYVIYRSRSMHSVTNMYIASVALADLILSIFGTPFQAMAALVQRWDSPVFMCNLCPFVLSLSVNISVLSMTCISVDRSKAITDPLNHKPSKQTAKYIILVVWLISILLASPQAYYHQFVLLNITGGEYSELVPYCQLHEGPGISVHTFFVLLSVVDYFLPVLIITAAYSTICIRLKKAQPGNVDTNRHSVRRGNKKKVEKMLILVVTLFIFCWTPYQAFYLLTGHGILKHYYSNVIFILAHWLAMSNSCYNPIIYAIYSTKFRGEFHRLLKGFSYQRIKSRLSASRKRKQLTHAMTLMTTIDENSIELNQHPNNLDQDENNTDLNQCPNNLDQDENNSDVD